MIEDYDLLQRARCGEFNWMCCLPLEAMSRLLSLYDQWGSARFMRVYRLVCACNVPEKPPPTPGKTVPPEIVVVPPEKVPPTTTASCPLPAARSPR